jgi:WD40 repeat protein
VDDKYFISGSLDNKIRIWNIPEHRVIDWTDMREMVTACTYTGDGSVSHPKSVASRVSLGGTLCANRFSGIYSSKALLVGALSDP